MSERSVNLTTLFLGRLRSPRRLFTLSAHTFASSCTSWISGWRKCRKNFLSQTRYRLRYTTKEYKYLSWVYGVDRKICHEGHWSASRGLPDFSIHTIPHDRYFFLHTFWFTIFDFQSSTCYNVTFFPVKSFYSILKKLTLPATAIRFLTLTSNLHKVTSFFDVVGCKNKVTWRRRYVTSNTTNVLNSRDFYPVLGEIAWVR